MSGWGGAADAYSASFATLCSGTVERLLADTPGGNHLEVGSGTGMLAARAVALGRRVVALDADPDMVAMSGLAVPGCVLAASLPDLPFDDGSFDAVTANFVINHVQDPRAAMGELARVMRPGGRLAVTIWPARTPAWAALVAGAFSAAGVVPISSRQLSAELDFDRSVDGLRGLSEAAGLETLTAIELNWVWEISVEALWGGVAGGVATVGQTFLAQAPDVQQAAEREFCEAMTQAAVDGVLSLPSTAAYLVAA